MNDTTTARVIGRRYRLESVIGRGGMGVVWSARDEVLGRPVAVKEVLPVAGLAPDELAVMRRRTLDEARNAARLSSGASVLVYDVVEEDGEPWIVMERLAARTLADVLHEREVLATHEVAELGLRLLSALDAAHAVGVLHRDVKPSNVMFRGDERMGNAVLTDFGVARYAGDPSATATGTLIGSPAFVSPERAGGAPASAASDLWALGVTLWIATEGISPFHRDGTLPTLTAVLTADPPSLHLAGPLAPLLTGLLHKDPAQRLSAVEARRLLERVHGPRTTRRADAPTAALPAADTTGTHTVPDVEPQALPDDARGRPRGRGRLAAVVAAVVAIGAVALAAQLAGGPSTDRGDVAGASPSASASAAAVPTTPSTQPSSSPASPSAPPSSATPSATPSATTATTAAPDPSATGGAAPAGMRRYADRTGFSVAVPSDWTADRRGGRVYLRDPGSSAYLLVDQTTTPAADPVADWQQQERVVSQKLSNYHLVRIDPLQVNGWRGADWEFTHGSGTHVLNRNLVTGPNQAYALYWSVPSRSWGTRLAQFEQITASFQPRG